MKYQVVSRDKQVVNDVESLKEAKFIGSWIKTVHPDFKVVIKNEKGREWVLIKKED